MGFANIGSAGVHTPKRPVLATGVNVGSAGVKVPRPIKSGANTGSAGVSTPRKPRP